MNIAICGASGGVGSELCRYLESVGHNINPIDRRLFAMNQLGNLQSIIDESDVVINLCGAPINDRWSRRNLRNIFDSRINVTKLLVDMINRSKSPSLFISASAAGFHSSELLSRPDIENDETLSDLVDRWEQQARRVNLKTRLVILRLGLVFTPHAGALPKMIESSRWGFLSRIGSPYKPLPWIAIEDVVRAIEEIIEREEISGAVNMVNPEPSTQSQFLHSAKRALGVRFILQIPTIILRILYGRAAGVLLKSRYSPPLRLQQMNYRFKYPTLESYFRGVNLSF